MKSMKEKSANKKKHVAVKKSDSAKKKNMRQKSVREKDMKRSSANATGSRMNVNN